MSFYYTTHILRHIVKLPLTFIIKKLKMHNRIWNKFHLLEGCFLCLVQTTMPKPCEIYNALVAEVALQTHHIVDSGGDPDTIY